MATVVVGQNFHGNLAPAPADKTPTRQVPQVTSNAALTRSLLAQAARKVPFKLEVPRLIESNSRLDYETPVRIYRIKKGYQGVRLTFRNGASEYWGIQQTNWNEAPALADASFVHPTRVASSRSTTPARISTWSCCARTARRTGW